MNILVFIYAYLSIIVFGIALIFFFLGISSFNHQCKNKDEKERLRGLFNNKIFISLIILFSFIFVANFLEYLGFLLDFLHVDDGGYITSLDWTAQNVMMLSMNSSIVLLVSLILFKKGSDKKNSKLLFASSIIFIINLGCICLAEILYHLPLKLNFIDIIYLLIDVPAIVFIFINVVRRIKLLKTYFESDNKITFSKSFVIVYGLFVLSRIVEGIVNYFAFDIMGHAETIFNFKHIPLSLLLIISFVVIYQIYKSQDIIKYDESPIIEDLSDEEKEDIYQKAKAVEDSKDSKLYCEQIVQLNRIKDYKDSQLLIKKFSSFNKSKVGKVVAITLSLIAGFILTFCIVITMFPGCSTNDKPALAPQDPYGLIADKNYDEAEWVISQLEPSEEKNILLLMCDGGRSFEDGDYEDGIYQFNLIQNGIVYVYYDYNGGDEGLSSEEIYKRLDTPYITQTTTKPGYNFVGWELTDYSINPFDYSAEIYLCAAFEEKQGYYFGAYVYGDEEAGTIYGTGIYKYGETVKVSISNNPGYVFECWVDNYGDIISDVNPFVFEMPNYDFTLYARLSYDYDMALGVKPCYNGHKNTYTYGIYPQSYVSDSSLVNELENYASAVNEDNWYYYNESFYVKLVSNPRNTNYKFNNGTPIVRNETYWFECNFIVWKVINVNDNGEIYLLANDVLDNGSYQSYLGTRSDGYDTIYPNNYKYSELRRFLIDEFYTKVLGLTNTSYIVTTEVDNSASSTYQPEDNPFACANTYDPVFVPSYQDLINVDYGIYNEVYRVCYSSEYARAKGAFISTDEEHYNRPLFWTRSPLNANYDDLVVCVDYDGYLKYTDSNVSSIGIRPAIIIKL